MKTLKKTLAVLLVAALLASSLCLTAFAAEDTDISRFSEGTGYLAFGDSITRGYGASDLWDDEGYKMDNTNDPDCRNVTGSYPKLVADAIGCNTPNSILDKSGEYWPIAADGLSTAYFIDLLGLEDDYCDSVYLYENNTHRTRYTTSLEYFGDPLSYMPDGESRYGQTGTAYSVRYLVQNSPLISIAIGMGDTLNRARTLATKGVDISTTDGIVTALEKFAEYLAEGYAYWAENFPLILDYFKENAPEDGVVVIIGALNPVNNMEISDEYPVPVGSLVSMYTELMNMQYKQWAEEYGFIYVDISSVETGSSENEVSIIDFIKSKDKRFQGVSTHPTATGYQQIADAILYELREHESVVQSRKTDIRIDLGRITEPSYVLVNGNTTTNYTVKDGILTIHYGLTTATSVAVAAKGDNGKTSVSVYSLSYDNGYSAKRLYTTNDVGKAASTVVTKVVSGFKAIGNLFKK